MPLDREKYKGYYKSLDADEDLLAIETCQSKPKGAKLIASFVIGPVVNTQYLVELTSKRIILQNTVLDVFSKKQNRSVTYDHVQFDEQKGSIEFDLGENAPLVVYLPSMPLKHFQPRINEFKQNLKQQIMKYQKVP